ncbi:glycosyltransferase family 32 protein [Myriangium duriaei CBS 260.36]|uniref:Glycosyltransferase family 32 protein n=1 Tax=Myriangium duriaei CBS 260.36 TaxID=1168546 RepID=A0A9P4J6F1_9PEZI|nr:glycosyltransferase family 32 protein [Myriangium duriaei CBS 260.36]
MLTFKRALLVAGALLTLFFLLRATHSDDSVSPLSTARKSPKPTGSYQENKKIQLAPEDAIEDDFESDADESKETEREHRPSVTHNKKQRPQVPLTDLRARPLRQQLAYQFPYELETKFPGYIWQTWKYTPAEGGFSDTYRPYEASWTEKHPGFVHEVITDSVAVHLINHLYSAIPEVVEAYQSLPVAVLKADFFRYLILLARGGIYSDIDTAAIQSAVDWVPAEVSRQSYGMVIGIEADPDRPDWAEWYSRRIQFCQWTIQSKPGHPILREIVASITEDTLRRKRAGTLTKSTIKSIVEFTGPAIWTDKIFDFFNDPTYFDMATSKGNITWKDFTGITKAKKVGDVIVLPITSFSPGVKTMGAGEDDDPMAFVKHNFEGSWKPESERHIGEEGH